MRTGRIVSEHPKRCRTALVYWQYSIWCHPCSIFLFFVLISMWFQSVVQPGHAECCWHCEGTVLTKGFGGPGKICLFLCLPCPTPFPPQYLYSEILAEICAPLSALSHKAATWRWFNPSGCSPTCLAGMESIGIEGGPILLSVLVSMWQSLPSFALMPVPQKSCVVTSVLQGGSSIFNNYVLFLMMLHYIRIF